MLVDQPDLPIVSMASPIRVILQGQQVSKVGHGLIGMVIIDGIVIVSGRGPKAGRSGGFGSPLALLGIRLGLLAARLVKVDVAGE
jgi:hypothetical protein